MKILGIDPGTRRIGYGLIAKERGRLTLIEAGLVPLTGIGDDARALQETKTLMDALVARTKPDLAVVEKLFLSNNQKTAMRVAEARGVILLSLIEHECAVRECGPNEVKAAVAGYGRADKRAVAKMVRIMLRVPDLDAVDDVTDALAIALTGAQLEIRRISSS